VSTEIRQELLVNNKELQKESEEMTSQSNVKEVAEPAQETLAAKSEKRQEATALKEDNQKITGLGIDAQKEENFLEKGVQTVQSTCETDVQDTSTDSTDAPMIAAGQNDENIEDNCVDQWNVFTSLVKTIENDKLIKKSVKTKSSENAKRASAKLNENAKRAAEKGVEAVQSASETDVQDTSVDAAKIAAGQNDENIVEDCVDQWNCCCLICKKS
jgi:hypothetical protein